MQSDERPCRRWSGGVRALDEREREEERRLRDENESAELRRHIADAVCWLGGVAAVRSADRAGRRRIAAAFLLRGTHAAGRDRRGCRSSREGEQDQERDQTPHV